MIQKEIDSEALLYWRNASKIDPGYFWKQRHSNFQLSVKVNPRDWAAFT